jgi:hypothetical protein
MNRTLAALFAAALTAAPALGQDGDAGFSRGLSQASAPRPHAAPILLGPAGEHISVFAVDGLGRRAVLARMTRNPFTQDSSIVLSALEREDSGRWREKTLVSRGSNGADGNRVLTPLALSEDGLHLVYSRTIERGSRTRALRVSVIDTGEDFALGAWDEPDALAGNRDADLALAVSASAWYKASYPGSAYETVFRDSKARCSGAGDLKASIAGNKTLVLSQGGKSWPYSLNAVSGSDAFAFQAGDQQRASSADCARSLMTVAELEWRNESERPYSFAYGRPAFPAQMRVLEISAR